MKLDQYRPIRPLVPCMYQKCNLSTGNSRLMRISLLWFFKTITIYMRFYGLFILLLRTQNRNIANAIFG